MVDMPRMACHHWCMPAPKPVEKGTRLPQLLTLPVETWGQRFRRARGDISLEEAARRISELAQPASYMVPARLEQLTGPPKSRRSQVTAILFLLSYGIDPAEFDLDIEALPKSLDVSQILFVNAPPARTGIARNTQTGRSGFPLLAKMPPADVAC